MLLNFSRPRIVFTSLALAVWSTLTPVPLPADNTTLGMPFRSTADNPQMYFSPTNHTFFANAAASVLASLAQRRESASGRTPAYPLADNSTILLERVRALELIEERDYLIEIQARDNAGTGPYMFPGSIINLLADELIEKHHYSQNNGTSLTFIISTLTFTEEMLAALVTFTDKFTDISWHIKRKELISILEALTFIVAKIPYIDSWPVQHNCRIPVLYDLLERTLTTLKSGIFQQNLFYSLQHQLTVTLRSLEKSETMMALEGCSISGANSSHWPFN